MGEGSQAFTLPEWTFIIGDSLVKRDLVGICGRLGVEFPGRRLEALHPFSLAKALAEIVVDEPGPDRDLILDRVRTSNQMLAERVRTMTLEELNEGVFDPTVWPQSATPGRILWVLKNDSRAGVRKLSAGLSRFLKEEGPPLDEAEDPPRSGPVLKDAVAEMREATDKLTELAAGERRRAERDGRRIRDLEAQVAELRRQAAERDEKLTARKAEVEAAQSATQKAQRESEAIRAKLKAHPPESWEAERRRLDHEVKALTRELEEERAARRKALEEADRKAKEEILAEQERAGAATRAMEAARKEAEWLREKLKTPVAPPPPVRRDPDRIALFVETQSLYYLAVARHSRVDYRSIFERCTAGGPLGRALAYTVEVPGTDPTAFKQVLHSLGFQVRSKPGRSASIWTSGLEADLKDAARTCGRIFIATGNPELAGALAALASEGAAVTLVSFEDPAVNALRTSAGEFIAIDSTMLRPIPARM